MIELIQKNEILSAEFKRNKKDVVVTDVNLNSTVSDRRVWTMMQMLILAAPFIARQVMPAFMQPADVGRRETLKAQRVYRDTLFKSQPKPQHIKRDSHHTLPGHHHKRSVR